MQKSETEQPDLSPTHVEDEAVAARREQREEALSQQAAMKALTASSGWAILVGIMDEQIQARLDNIVLKPLTDTASQFNQEFAKGEVAMIKTLKEIVRTLSDTADAVVDSLTHESEEPTDG